MNHGKLNNKQGKRAEILVKRYLKKEKYKVSDKNYLSGIDIIAHKNKKRYYIEVKSKKDSRDIKHKRYCEITSKLQIRILKKIFTTKLSFILFVVRFPSEKIEMYFREDLQLRIYKGKRKIGCLVLNYFNYPVVD